MVENDNFAHLVKQSLTDQTNAFEQSLITQERIQKLELLIHLISNLTEAIVVCGPEGIGKTTLLKILQERILESWHCCPVQASADLNLDTITDVLSQWDAPDKQIHGAKRPKRTEKTLLIIDDAGLLIPGLVAKIIEYASTHPALRVLFVLTHDDFFIKNSSDPVINDCHFVEIPPLSEKQCGDFLQYLSALPSTGITTGEVNDAMVEAVYRETHGIPGKIISAIPSLASSKRSDSSLLILIAAVVALVAIALGIQWFSSRARHDQNIPKPATEQSAVDNK